MAVPRNTDFITGTVVQAAFLNRLQELLSAVAINAELSLSGTQVLLSCATGDGACVVAINGKLRYSETTKSVDLTALPAGTYGIWFTTSSDDNDASFTMSASVSPPSGSYVRQIGTVDWSGSALSNLRQVAGYDKHSYMHAVGADDPLPAASVSYAMLASDAASKVIPVGAVMEYGGSAAPSGWLLCDGSEVSRTTYAGLFAAIGTTYGAGNGTTTFNVPDGRGRTIFGKGTHLDVDTLGDNEGQATVNLRTPNHVHTVPAHGHGKGTLSIPSGGSHSHSASTDPGHAHSVGPYGMVYTPGAGNCNVTPSNVWTAGLAFNTDAAGAHSHTIYANTHSHPNGEFAGSVGPNTLGDSALDTSAQTVAQRVPFLVTNYIIKV